jgi:biopolymer transport protein ExbD
MKMVSLLGVRFLLAMSVVGVTMAAYSAESAASSQTDPVVFAINDDGSYSFQGKAIDEGTLKGRLMITAMRAPQPPVQVGLNGNGNKPAVQKSLQQFKSEAASAGIANVVVSP